MKRCKECGQRRRKGKGLKGEAADILELCSYCYGWKFPEREPKLPPLRQGSRRLLSWDERRNLERYRAFEGMEQLLWMPEFYEEWLEFQVARRRGEICGSY